MIKDRRTLEEYLINKIEAVAFNTEKCNKIYEYANQKYEIPKGNVSDIVFKRIMLSEVSEFVLFIMLDSICLVEGKTTLLGRYYTDNEIKFYEKSKYETSKIKFPLIFKMLQVANDQWIGKTSIDMLMKLRHAQLINYNVNAQRTMQKVVRGSKENYRIALNQKAVKEIKSLYEDDLFIPNTITLNIPLETEFNFHYDEDSCSFIIKSLEHFDITDGYHRYIAACQAKDLNPDFDYPMELRIVNFSEDKAKQYIFQEDQKTKMSRVDSNSMNMNSAANILVTRLNENIRCNIKGLIGRNEGNISFGELAQFVDYFYFKNVSKDKERITSIKVLKELTDKFNTLTEYNTKYLEEKINYRTLLAIMFCFDYFEDGQEYEMCETIDKLSEALNKSTNSKLLNKKPRHALMSVVEKIMKEEI